MFLAPAVLTFKNRWTFEGTTICYDGGVLEIKIGSGSFTDIVAAGGSFVSGGYNGSIASTLRGSPASAMPGSCRSIVSIARCSKPCRPGAEMR